MRWLLFLACLLCFHNIAVSETFVVCVGVGNYADSRVSNLVKAESDAKSVAEFFKKGTDKVIIITGKYATKSQILSALRSQFNRAKQSDRIIFYFSGHGYPGGFCPFDMHTIDDGLTYAEVVSIMNESRAKDKLIFADACNSGALRKSGKDNHPDYGNILFFLSSRGNEKSLENAFLANGYFTKRLLRGLGGGADSDGNRKITAAELFKFVSDGVKRDTSNRQHPVMWGNFPDNLVIVEYH